MLLDWKYFCDTLVPLIPLKCTWLFCRTPLPLGNHLWLSVTQNVQMWLQISLAASRVTGVGSRDLCTLPRAQLSKALELPHWTNFVGTTHQKYYSWERGSTGCPSGMCVGCAGLANAEISQKSSVSCEEHLVSWEHGCVHESLSFLSNASWQVGTTALISHRFSSSVLEHSKSFVQILKYIAITVLV